MGDENSKQDKNNTKNEIVHNTMKDVVDTKLRRRIMNDVDIHSTKNTNNNIMNNNNNKDTGMENMILYQQIISLNSIKITRDVRRLKRRQYQIMSK